MYLKSLINLSPFYEFTELLCGSKYISLGLIIAGITNIENIFQTFICQNESNKEVIKPILGEIAENFQAFSDISLIGLFLDIRLKFDNLTEYIDQNDAIKRIK